MTNQSGGSSTQVDTILCRRCHLKEVSDCKPVVGESVASQQRALVWKITTVVRKVKRPKTEQKTNWWKLKKERCVTFRKELRRTTDGREVLQLM